MVNKTDYVNLGLDCAKVCEALYRGTSGKKLEDLSPPARNAIEQLMMWVKTAIYDSDSTPTTLLIVEPSRRSRKMSMRSANGIDSPELSMQRVIRLRSPVGTQTSIGSFRSSQYVQSSSLDCH